MIRRPLLVLLAAAALPLNGCQTLARQAFANPVVEVTDVRVRSIGLMGGTLDVVLDIYNPNEYRLDAEKISYNFFVDTTRVVSGELDRLLTLEQKGRLSLTVPVTFGFNEMAIAMNEYLTKGALDYRVTGQFTIVTTFGRITRPYSGTGRVEGMP
jgi:LEA14-like dessication related protein